MDARDADEALATAWRGGDVAAAGEAFVLHSELVRRFSARITGWRDHDLEDLVQQVFVEAHRGIRGFRGESRLSSWLCGIAVRVAARQRRRRRRQAEAFASLAELAPSTSSPHAAEAQQALARLATALGELDEPLRVAFVMCAVERIPGREAAAVLGVREGTLAKRVHEARTRLRRAIEWEVS